MKVEDCLTGDLLPITSARLLDGSRKYVARDTYVVASHLLRKGLINKEDLLESQKILDDFNTALHKLHYKVRKYCNIKRRAIRGVLREIAKIEQVRAIELFKKYRVALKKQEHTVIINSILNDSFLNEIDGTKIVVTTHTLAEDMEEYFLGLEHMLNI